MFLLLDFMFMESARIYVSGENLFTFSAFKLWDPEMEVTVCRYPINRRFNLGLQLNFNFKKTHKENEYNQEIFQEMWLRFY